MFKAAKYPALGGFSQEPHQALLCIPPPPPAPPLPSIPVHLWFATIGQQAAGLAVTGKWSWSSVSEDFMGIILQGHDWGFLQPHLYGPPVTATPTFLERTFKNTTKYWLGASSVQSKKDGSFPGPAGTLAVSTPAWFILCQQCCDIAGKSFFLPTAIIIQAPGTLDISITFADLLASFMGMVVDSAVSLLGSVIPSPPGKPSFEISDFVVGQVIGYFVNVATQIHSHALNDDPHAQQKSYVFQTACMVAGILGKGGNGGEVLEEMVKMTGNFSNDGYQAAILGKDTKAGDYNELLKEQRQSP